MGIASTVAGFTNIGHDLQATITGTDGVSVLVPNVMSFEWREMTTDITHMHLNGRTIIADIPRNYEGSIEFHRKDDTVEGMFADMQQDWFDKADYELGTIKCTVNGKFPGHFTFLDCSYRLEEGGRWRGDEVTICRIAFRAAQMTSDAQKTSLTEISKPFGA